MKTVVSKLFYNFPQVFFGEKILIIITYNGKPPDRWHWKGWEYLRPHIITSVNSSSIAVPTASSEGAEEGTQDLSWIQVNYSEQDICQCAFNFTFLYFWFEEWIFAGCLWFQRFLFQNCWKTLGPHHIRKLFTLRLHRLNRGREVRSECRVGLEATKSKGKNSHWTASTPGLSTKARVMLSVSLSWWEKERAQCLWNASWICGYCAHWSVSVHPCSDITLAVLHPHSCQWKYRTCMQM